MSHIERNSACAAYIHKAEHLDERREMLQWWADFLEANRNKAVSPFDFAKLSCSSKIKSFIKRTDLSFDDGI